MTSADHRRPAVRGKSADAGPAVRGEPADAGPAVGGEPADAGPAVRDEPADAGPAVRGEPAARRRPSLWRACAAWLYDPFLALGERRGMAALRRELLAVARGRVLEVGAGTGRNLDAYPARLDELVLTEPDPSILGRLRRRVERSPIDARVLAADAESLPFPDASFDTVVSTMVLCTVDDPDAGAHELRRVLRPGGQLLFIEHVRASDARLARMQDRFAGAWGAFAAAAAATARRSRCWNSTSRRTMCGRPCGAGCRASWRRSWSAGRQGARYERRTCRGRRGRLGGQRPQQR